MWPHRQRPGSNLSPPFARVRDIRSQSRSLGRSVWAPRHVRFFTFMSYTHLHADLLVSGFIVTLIYHAFGADSG